MEVLLARTSILNPVALQLLGLSPVQHLPLPLSIRACSVHAGMKCELHGTGELAALCASPAFVIYSNSSI